ncbi:hypothetical protein T10_9241 [Trichinella papuae]|uniref:Uncharacterized protein n=1 Tax=Trichinella papuae TaxID=268474 RepID=A0A0V1M0T2_9BILA|nr:hypothetical protein T10_9241 [Trichinella papuae]
MSCDKEAQVRDLIRRVPVFRKKGGFHLKKRTSNRVELLDTLPEEDVSTNGEKETGKNSRVLLHKEANVEPHSTVHRPEEDDISTLVDYGTGLGRTITTTDRETTTQPNTVSNQNQQGLDPVPDETGAEDRTNIFDDASQAAYAACAYTRGGINKPPDSAELGDGKILSSTNKTNQSPSAGADDGIGASARKKPFVANRVQEIHESAFLQCWRYCPTKENPADIPSRGCSLDTLTNSALWWHGSPWLRQNR